MIYVDIEKEEMEFECNGETMLKEMALLLTTSILESVNDDVMPMPVGLVPVLVDSLMDTLGAIVKDAVEMGVKDYGEEEEISEERSSEEVRTIIKQYRRGRTGRTTS